MRKLEEDLARKALTAEQHAEYASLLRRLAENSRTIPAMVASGDDLPSILAELVERVSSRLAKGETDAGKDRRDKGAAELPWVHHGTPKKMKEDLERLRWFNDRIRAFTAERMMKHAATAEFIEVQIAAVDAVLTRQQDDLGKVLTTFARRLKAAGLATASVKDLSNEAIGALAAALNGKHEVDLLHVLGVEAKSRVMTDAQASDIHAELDRLQREREGIRTAIADLGALQPSPDLPVEPVVPDVRLDNWDYADGPLPPEWWSAVEGAPDHTFIVRRATPEEEHAIPGMSLPEAHDWVALRAWNKLFWEIAGDLVRTRRGAEMTIRDFFEAEQGLDPDSVGQNLIRAWLFLLHARLMPTEARDALFGAGYFDGIVVPCYASGPGIVRELRWTGSPEHQGGDS